MDQILGMSKQQYSRLNANQWNTLTIEFSEKFYAVMAEDLLPLYKKHFTQKELRDINKFLASDLGQKYILKSTDVSKESMSFAMKWSTQAPAIVKEIIEKHGW